MPHTMLSVTRLVTATVAPEPLEEVKKLETEATCRKRGISKETLRRKTGRFYLKNQLEQKITELSDRDPSQNVVEQLDYWRTKTAGSRIKIGTADKGPNAFC